MGKFWGKKQKYSSKKNSKKAVWGNYDGESFFYKKKTIFWFEFEHYYERIISFGNSGLP